VGINPTTATLPPQEVENHDLLRHVDAVATERATSLKIAKKKVDTVGIEPTTFPNDD
jgi:hypothetical protein